MSDARRSPSKGRGSGAEGARARTDRDRSASAGVAARRLAAEVLERIDTGGSYANLVLGPALDRSGLDTRDRNYVTQLVYGATRMRRSCDWLVDRFVLAELDSTARAFLRVGAYQLAFLDTPAHAAVSATVDAAPKKLRGLVNAVLRRVAQAPRDWPDDGIRLSYPDWMIERLDADLGTVSARAALAAMNDPPPVTERDDGYVQDLASQWVGAAVDAQPGERVLDLCAAPGGKATALAAHAAFVVAADVRPSRLSLVADNVERLGLGDSVGLVALDGTAPGLRPGSFARVLVDAPCSGLGSLRRRPDARWRIKPTDVTELAVLQQRLMDAAVPLVQPGGVLIYSVCTLTMAETRAIDEFVASAHPTLEALAPPDEPWTALGRGALLVPQAAGTDGMYVLRLRVPA